MKPSTVYVCEKCDAQSPKWAGRCFECGEWGGLKETIPTMKQFNNATISPAIAAKPMLLGDIVMPKAPKLASGINEFDRVLGGGITPGGVILLAGEPGIGKSTLLAQVCGEVAKKSGAILYTSGEESAEQIHARFARIGAIGSSILFLQETDAHVLAATIIKERPALAVVDSINTVRGPGGKSGTPAEIRAAVGIIVSAAKESNVPVVLVGQVRKDGEVAGPKSLEHLVDVVLQLEGDSQYSYRVLRASKNRFGASEEVGIFNHTEKGLEQVPNPSALFLGARSTSTAGSVVTVLLEGTRPILAEIQALTSKSAYGYPQRRASGIDPKRLDMILAVLTRRAGMRLEYTDVHVNVGGGLKVREPAADLSILASIASAYMNKPFNNETVAIGEVGLSGVVGPTKDMERRVREAQKLGFKYALVPESAKLKPNPSLVFVRSVNDVLDFIK